MASEAVLKGWNGNLRISDEGVTTTRGLKGFLRRNPRRQPLHVSYAEIRRVRFMAATKVVGRDCSEESGRPRTGHSARILGNSP
jgi:hypothetical protein